MRALALLMLFAGPAPAQSLMTAEEFEAWSTGRTLDYAIDGQYWGSEMHLPGRQTLDADAEGPCLRGIWFPKEDAICFVYDGIEGEHCWLFRRDALGVTAEIADTPGAPLARVTLAPEPLACPGPEVGV
jgi:hypothetical protein